MSRRLRFFGHACFGLKFAKGPHLCIDPYRPGGFGGLIALRPVQDRFDFVISTHAHEDHDATDCIEGTVIRAPFEASGLRISAVVFDHDEFGGRLRGGQSNALVFDYDGCRIVHMGDIGERATEQKLAPLKERPIDVLIIPVGGYFTIGPDAAYELAEQLKPRIVVPCHAREHGALLPHLGSEDAFLRRFHEEEIARRPSGELTVNSHQSSDEPGMSICALSAICRVTSEP